jgi:anti-sigma-K factor RskA
MIAPLDELLDLAAPYALHAVGDDERADIERRLAQAPGEVATAFRDEVRAIHETLAVVSVATALEPPPVLRDRVLASVGPPQRKFPWQRTLLAAAAVLIIGLGAVTAGLALRPAPTRSTAEQVFAAPDVHTVSGPIPGGGTATVVFSRDKNAGVLVMNNVPPPKPGTVYQMWLIGDTGPTSAGTMDDKSVAPSTTAVLPDIRNSNALAFTVEPGTGSTKPTGEVFAKLPLT